MKEATQFYGNRILKDFREKCAIFTSLHFYNSCYLDRDPTHVEWVRAYTAIFDDLKKYVMEYHTTGLYWNAKVRDPSTFPINLWANELHRRVYPSPSIRLRRLLPRLVAPPRLHLRHHLSHRHRVLLLLLPPPAVASRRCLRNSIADQR